MRGHIRSCDPSRQILSLNRFTSLLLFTAQGLAWQKLAIARSARVGNAAALPPSNRHTFKNTRQLVQLHRPYIIVWQCRHLRSVPGVLLNSLQSFLLAAPVAGCTLSPSVARRLCSPSAIVLCWIFSFIIFIAQVSRKFSLLLPKMSRNTSTISSTANRIALQVGGGSRTAAFLFTPNCIGSTKRLKVHSL